MQRRDAVDASRDLDGKLLVNLLDDEELNVLATVTRKTVDAVIVA